MESQILHQQIQTLYENFHKIDLEDIESKVSNIKQRIFLMNKLLGIKPPTITSTTQPIKKKDTKEEMNSLRAKLRPKVTKEVKEKPFPYNVVRSELEKADEDLKKALDDAFAKIK